MISPNGQTFKPKVNFGWISESFYLFQRDYAVWILGTLLTIVVAVLVSLVIQHFVPTTAPPGTDPSKIFLTPHYWTNVSIDSIMQFPFYAFFYGAGFKASNKVVRGQALTFSDIFAGSSTYLNFLIFCVVLYVFQNIGFFACIVGSIIVSALLMLTFPLLADGVPVRVAMSRSYNAVKGDWLNATGFVFVASLLFVLSLFCCIGWLVTIPMICIMNSLAYRDMIGMTAAASDVPYLAPEGSWPPAPHRQEQSASIPPLPENPSQGSDDDAVG